MANELMPGLILNRSLRDHPALQSVLNFLLGRQFVDLPIRVLALLDLVAGFSPRTMESSEPLYLLFHFSSRALLVVASFAPVTAGIVAIALFLLHMAVLPEFLDQFQWPLAFSAAVLLTRLQWKSSLLFSITVVALTWIASQFGMEEGYASSYEMILYEWLRNSALALSAVAVERRLRKEVDRRLQAELTHESTLQAERIGFAMNVHDTLSQGLAQQGILIKLLSTHVSEINARVLLSELTFANSDTQHQLRKYMLTLANGRPGAAHQAPQRTTSWADWEESARRGAEAGRLSLQVTIDPRCHFPIGEKSGDIELLLREVVTNMVKHSSDATGRIVIKDAGTDAIEIEATNPTAEDKVRVSRSIMLRAQKLLADPIEVRNEVGTYRIRIRIAR